MSTIYVSTAHSLVGRLVILLSLFTLLGPVLSSAENLTIDSAAHLEEPVNFCICHAYYQRPLGYVKQGA